MSRVDNPEYTEKFYTLNSIKLPRPLKMSIYFVFLLIIITIIFLTFVPWVQTSTGFGTITALKPENRIQSINALVSGRIAKWYVKDGSQVKKGDLLAKIIDNDEGLIARLIAEKNAIEDKYNAIQRSAKIAELDYKRQKDLFQQGLSSRREKEQSLIKYEDLKSKASSAEAELKNVEINLSRQEIQTVKAPQDGTILNINSGDVATFVKMGDKIANFLPSSNDYAAEIYVRGLDASIISPGRKVRLIFEGWPAFQISGWPEAEIGTFEGIVYSVDPALSANGLIRVLIIAPEDKPWPKSRFLRFGAKVQGWILLDKVSIGYEIWRQLNGFPPRFPTTSKDITINSKTY